MSQIEIIDLDDESEISHHALSDNASKCTSPNVICENSSITISDNESSSEEVEVIESAPYEINAKTSKGGADLSEEISFAFQNDTTLSNHANATRSFVAGSSQNANKKIKISSTQSLVQEIIDDSSDEDLSGALIEKFRQKNARLTGKHRLSSSINSSRIIGDIDFSFERPVDFGNSEVNVLSQGSQKELNRVPSSPKDREPVADLFLNSSPIPKCLFDIEKSPINVEKESDSNKIFYSSASSSKNTKEAAGQSSDRTHIMVDKQPFTKSLQKTHLVRKKTDIPILDLANNERHIQTLSRSFTSPSVELNPQRTREYDNSNEPSHNGKKTNPLRTFNYITNAKNFSEQEFQGMLHYFNRSSALKKSLTEVNKVHRTTEELCLEIVMDFHPGVYNMIKDEGIVLEEELMCNVSKSNSFIASSICFKRKVRSIYDIDHDIFFPCSEKLVEEPSIMMFYDSFQFFLNLQENKSELLYTLQKLKDKYMRVVVVLNNFQKLESSLRRLYNGIYISEVRNNLHPGEQRKKTSKKSEELEKLKLRAEDLHVKITEVAVLCGVHVFPMANTANFVEWSKNILLNVSRSRYETLLRNIECSHLHVKSGQTPLEVFEKSLEQFNMITKAKSQRISSEYPSFQAFFQNMNNIRKGPDGKNLIPPSSLEAIQILFSADDPFQFIYK
ncbi:hypothetical protein ACO0RG_003522 [Hanseniaspora osmophila]|uniref:Crossover junction endonuclease EME1 n=1 Tax=Hanseniaspora osmophila TaxID=56408 RepID=A0A1E5RE54_9ASCO|nr:Crossover junction endonuclease EME1 [Hanseniaspora osmophila]